MRARGLLSGSTYRSQPVIPPAPKGETPQGREYRVRRAVRRWVYDNGRAQGMSPADATESAGRPKVDLYARAILEGDAHPGEVVRGDEVNPATRKTIDDGGSLRAATQAGTRTATRELVPELGYRDRALVQARRAGLSIQEATDFANDPISLYDYYSEGGFAGSADDAARVRRVAARNSPSKTANFARETRAQAERLVRARGIAIRAESGVLGLSPALTGIVETGDRYVTGSLVAPVHTAANVADPFPTLDRYQRVAEGTASGLTGGAVYPAAILDPEEGLQTVTELAGLLVPGATEALAPVVARTLKGARELLPKRVGTSLSPRPRIPAGVELPPGGVPETPGGYRPALRDLTPSPDVSPGVAAIERRLELRSAPAQTAPEIGATSRVDVGGGPVQPKRRTGPRPGPREIRGGWFSDEAAAAARERLAAKRRESGGMYGAVSPESLLLAKIPELPEMVVLAGNHIRRAGETFGAWSREMVGLFGHSVRPNLRSAWDKAHALALHEVRTFDAAQIAAIANDPRPRPYADWKKGPNPWLLAPEDLDFARDRHGNLVIDVLETDRARADGYHNPITEARVRADGGIGFPLGVKENGIVAWTNMDSRVAENLQSRVIAAFDRYKVHPVTLTTLNTVENSLRSHGPAILRAEFYQARNRGVPEAQLVGHFNEALEEVVGGRLGSAQSIHDIRRILDSTSFINRGRIVKRVLGPKKPFGLPSAAEALTYLNDPALADLPTSTIVSALRVDPFTHGPMAGLGVRPHLVYPEGMGGTSLGMTRYAPSETLFDHFPDYTTQGLQRMERNGRGGPAVFTNALNRSMVYSGSGNGLRLIPESEVWRLFPAETQPRVQPRRASRRNRG